MFADLVTKTIPVPSDPGNSVVIRKLSWMERDEAQKIATARVMEGLGGVKGLREYVEAQRAEAAASPAPAPVVEPTAEERRAADFASHDGFTLLKYGVQSWTYKRAVSEQALRLIDEDTATFLAREIYELTRPRSADDAKNG